MAIEPPLAYADPMPVQSFALRLPPSTFASRKKSTTLRRSLSSVPVAASAKAPSMVRPKSAKSVKDS